MKPGDAFLNKLSIRRAALNSVEIENPMPPRSDFYDRAARADDPDSREINIRYWQWRFQKHQELPSFCRGYS